MIPSLKANPNYAQYLSIPQLPVAKTINSRYANSVKQPERSTQMAKSRKTGAPSEPGTEGNDVQKPAAGESPVESKLTLAEAKLERMQETNKLCFRHQNDFAKIQEELKDRFKFSEAEMEHILEPKGQRLIPGFGYAEMERQKQYVAFLKKNAEQRGATAAERVQQSREVDQEPAL